MPTFSNSPIPREPRPEVSPDKAAENTPAPLEAVTEEAVIVEPAAEAPAENATKPTESEPSAEAAAEETPAEETPAEAPAETATEAPAEPPKPAEPPMPWAIVVRHFTQAPAEACAKLNGDFGLSLTPHSFNRLQKLFRTLLNRDPTTGELYLLDTLDRQGQGLPRREAVGELYTDSGEIAETWADMMAKHAALFSPKGLLRKETPVPPPCTLEEALTLVGRYLYRTGAVTPLSDSLPYGGKNSDGRTAVLCSPAREAEAVAEGYTPLRIVELGDTTRSVWVRRGSPMTVTPERSGDFLVCLPSPDPAALMAVLEGERAKSRPNLGAIAAIARRSPLETVMTLCEGADLYPARLPKKEFEPASGSAELFRLCAIPATPPDARPDYLLRVPASKVRELSEALRALSITAVSVGQVKSGGQIRVYLRQGEKDVPVAGLSVGLLRSYPALALYRRQAEVRTYEPPQVAATPAIPVPEAGLLMAASSVAVSREGEGYTTAMEAVAAAVTPLTEDGTPTNHVRLSVSLTAADGEDAHGCMTLEVLCGLYRAAAEGGMAVEDPAFTVEPVPAEASPEVRLSVVAYRRM